MRNFFVDFRLARIARGVNKKKYVKQREKTKIVVVVITLTHNTMQSVVAGHAPITLGWKKYLGSKTEAK